MQLTPSDRELIQLITDGHTNRMIAHRMQLSTIAVADALAKLYRKLDATDRAGAIAAAARQTEARDGDE